MFMIKAKNAQRTFTPQRWINDADMLSDTESIQLFTKQLALYVISTFAFNSDLQISCPSQIMFLKVQTLYLP